ncbi:type I DNA topoisomerase [Persicobacter diffluens]|uniref:DNA topoisomerase 1 n=1 Tax=Persicobacter diffluens TaxID=981 RepID=A0AAN5ALL2_9BACT|nr:DNA topoisomerase 1 [Persicobacter diffluens]
MQKNLVIVESPAKAKTIEGYLGEDFKVVSSFGHVRDLPKGNGAIDIDNGFKPTYEVSPDKKEVIRDLKKLAKDAELIYLASDDDREGEAISWHLKETLKLEDARTKRIVFHEITKNAIVKAINNPRTIDENLVNAQQARRVLDRLVGFELSPVLWKKIKTGLSAGRVQSVAVRLVVEREREIDAHQVSSFFKVKAVFDLPGGKEVKAELPGRFNTEDEAHAFLNDCKGAEFKINNLEKKPSKKSPAPPFTTSTLQQEASRKLGFSVAKTMSVAQRLYEAGKITYMRTDSLNLSDDALAAAAKEVVSAYGEEYSNTRKYTTKNSSAQEAHEAIRPTNFALHKLSAGERDEQRLYELIWKRAIASQMSQAEIEKTTAKIGISSRPEELNATGQVVTFEGFLKVYIESTDDEENNEESKDMLPPLTIGQVLRLNEMVARQGFTRPPARFTEASLVKELEEKGIGRPSTYAPTISTVQRRNYVVKEPRDGVERPYRELTLDAAFEFKAFDKVEITGAEKNKLYPTDIGMVVNDFLVEYFPSVVDFSFTAKVEKEFDEIAQGQQNWDEMIGGFYGGFHQKVEQAEQIDRREISSARELGIDPKTGKMVIARLGRFGPLVQLGETSEEEGAEKPQFASLRKGQYLEKITLEEALELFKLPRDVGMYEDKKVVAAIGRFGPYIRHDGKFVSLGKEYDPLSVELDTAIELIEAKRKADREKFIKAFDEDTEVQVLNGRWGPYIKFGKKNVKIPKEFKEKPLEITWEQALEWEAATPEKGKKAAAKTTTAKKTTAKKAPAKKTAAKKTTTKKTTTAKKTTTKKV